MSKQDWQSSLSLFDKIFLGSLLVVFFGVFLHAPFIVMVGASWPDVALYVKAWKEIIMLVALISLLFVLWRKKQWKVLQNWLIWLMAVYSLIGIIMGIMSQTETNAQIAGLMIDYRYILAFGLFYVAGQIYPEIRKSLVTAGVAGMAIVVIFGVLQTFVLPHDALKYIGYNKETNIAPYLTVDENYNYIRINSTLRGPNVLGAMMVMSLGGIVSYLVVKRKELLTTKNKQKLWLLLAFFVGSLICLWASYSRSALGAALITVLLVPAIYYRNKISKKHIIGFLVGFLMVFFGIFALKDNHFISTVVLHEDPNEAGLVNSNDGHLESFIQGLQLMRDQPLGAGIGSTGSASLNSDKPLIIENQYLFIAHELGWIGLAIFLVLFGAILWLLWKIWFKKGDWLVLAVLASGIGLAIIGLVLPVWVDDTVSVVWWGAAGFIIGQYGEIIKGESNYGQKNSK